MTEALLSPPALIAKPLVRDLQLQPYETVWEAMRTFTQNRAAATPDELWLVEHPPVFTLGLAGKREHLLRLSDIPVVHSDRGGQVTYHGPGQAVVYTLLDIGRLQINIRALVSLLEQTMIGVLARYGIVAQARADAPGVYVGGKKIGSIGLRVKKNCSYHGLSLNNDMDLRPFAQINPCGYAGMEMTQLRDFGVAVTTSALAATLAAALLAELP